MGWAPFEVVDDRDAGVDPGGDEAFLVDAGDTLAEHRLLQAEADQRGADHLAEGLGVGELDAALGRVAPQAVDRELDPAADDRRAEALGELRGPAAVAHHHLDQLALAGELPEPPAGDQRELRAQVAERGQREPGVERVDRRDPLRERRLEQLLLAREVLVEGPGARREPGGGLDLTDRRAEVAALGEQLQRRRENPLAGRRCGGLRLGNHRITDGKRSITEAKEWRARCVTFVALACASAVHRSTRVEFWTHTVQNLTLVIGGDGSVRVSWRSRRPRAKEGTRARVTTQAHPLTAKPRPASPGAPARCYRTVASVSESHASTGSIAAPRSSRKSW